MGYLRAAGFWLLFLIITLIMFTVLVICYGSYRLLGRRTDLISHQVACAWAWLIIKLTPGWHVDIENAAGLPRHGAVIVSNHESMTDIWALFCMKIQFRWLSKAEVFKLPIIGQAMRWAGYIGIQRGNKGSHRRALEESAAWIRRGVPMVFFPEGTRSETGELRPFKVGAFKLADDEKVDIVPIATKGARDLIPKGSFIPGRATVRVRVLPAIQRQQDESLEDYGARARALISEAHKTL